MFIHLFFDLLDRYTSARVLINLVEQVSDFFLRKRWVDILQKGLKLLKVQLLFLIVKAQDTEKFAYIDIVWGDFKSETTHDSLQFIFDNLIVFKVRVKISFKNTMAKDIFPR